MVPLEFAFLCHPAYRLSCLFEKSFYKNRKTQISKEKYQSFALAGEEIRENISSRLKEQKALHYIMSCLMFFKG